MDRRDNRSWRGAICFAVLVAVFAPGPATAVGPDEVYTTLDLAEYCADLILEDQGLMGVETIELVEHDLGPMHIYQMAVATIDRMIAFERAMEIRPMPKVVSTPARYTAADAKRLADWILAEVQMVMLAQTQAAFPQYTARVTGKTSTDVFEKVLRLFVKFDALAGRDRITPNEVYAQAVRVVADVKSILGRIDSAHRYRIDAPPTPPDRTPADVFHQCLAFRREINELRRYLGLDTVPVPEVPGDRTLHPADVIVQTQILIAELNLLKLETRTVSATPLAIPVTGKNPTDVFEQVALGRYLLKQITTLQEMVREAPSLPDDGGEAKGETS